MNTDRTVLEGAVTGRFVKQGVADVLLSQCVGVPMDGPFRDVLQELAQPCTFLKRRARNDPLNELPSLINKKIVGRL
jgi:hypothetical protein